MHEPFIEKSRLLIKFKKYDKAIEFLKKGLQNDIENPIYYDLLGRCYFHLKDFLTCQKFYQKANKLNTTNAMYWLRLAEVNLQLKKLDVAERHVKNCQEINPNLPDAYYLLAAISFEKRKYRIAIVECDKALKLFPEHKNSLELKGIVLTVLNQLDEAEEINKNALNINPNSEKALANYGWNELRKGNVEKAKELFIEILQKDPSNLHALTGYKNAIRGRNKLQKILMKMEILYSQSPFIRFLYFTSILFVSTIILIYRIENFSEPFGQLILDSLLFFFITLYIPFKVLPQFSVVILMRDKIGKQIISKRRKLSGLISLGVILLGILALFCSLLRDDIPPFLGMLIIMVGIWIIAVSYTHLTLPTNREV